MSDKSLISRIYKLLTEINKTFQSPIKWGAKMNRHFSEDKQMASRHRRNCSASLITRKIQTKTATMIGRYQK